MSEQRNATTKTIKIPGPALGTHVYTALEYAKDGTNWDGGLVSNTPLQWVVDSQPRMNTLA